jgi:hypothetical protein
MLFNYCKSRRLIGWKTALGLHGLIIWVVFYFWWRSEEHFRSVRNLRRELNRRLHILENGGQNTWDLPDDEGE